MSAAVVFRGTVVLAKGFAAENVLNTIEKEKISVYFGVPTMFQMISEHPNFEITNFSSLRFSFLVVPPAVLN